MRKRYKKIPILDLMGRCIGFEQPEKQIKIVECAKAEADRIIVKNHYSHKSTKNSFTNLLVLYRGKVCGALQCGYGIRPKIKGGVGGTEQQPLRCLIVGQIWASKQNGKVYSPEGIAPCICVGNHAGVEPKIIVYEN